MPHSRRLACLSCLLLLGMALLPPLPASAAPIAASPQLSFEAPPELGDEAAALRWLPPERWDEVMALLGLSDPGPTIHVLLLPEEHPVARRTPRAITGFAIAAEDLVVLLPQRVSSYPYDSLPALLTHEVTHVLLSRAAHGESLPRWFQEGVALLAARERELADHERLLWGGIGGVPPSTRALDRAFAGEGYAVPTAYALAGALAHELVRRHGRQAVARIAAAVAAGEPFPRAFRAATGESLASFEEAFWRRFGLRYRWLPFLTSGATLWLGVTALALLAMARRRQRDAAIRRRWEEEELAALAAATVPGEESRWGPH